MKIIEKILTVLLVSAVLFSGIPAINGDFIANAASKPAKVNNLRVVNKHGTYSLKWKKAKGAKKYQVYFKKNNKKKYSRLKTVKKTKMSLSFLYPGKYYFKVRAINSKGKGKFSKTLKVKIREDVNEEFDNDSGTSEEATEELTKELSNLKAERSEARGKWEALTQELKEAGTEYDRAGYDFLNDRAPKDANFDTYIDYCRNNEAFSKMEIDDAFYQKIYEHTTIHNLREAIRSVYDLNDFRIRDGLKPLKVCDELMVYSVMSGCVQPYAGELDPEYSALNRGHFFYYHRPEFTAAMGENLHAIGNPVIYGENWIERAYLSEKTTHVLGDGTRTGGGHYMAATEDWISTGISSPAQMWGCVSFSGGYRITEEDHDITDIDTYYETFESFAEPIELRLEKAEQALENASEKSFQIDEKIACVEKELGLKKDESSSNLLPAPKHLILSILENSLATLSWDAVENADGYIVYAEDKVDGDYKAILDTPFCQCRIRYNDYADVLYKVAAYKLIDGKRVIGNLGYQKIGVEVDDIDVSTTRPQLKKNF